MLKHARISAKIVGTVVAVSLIGFGLSLYAAFQMQQIDESYSVLTSASDAAVVKVVRASRNLSEAAYFSYKALVYEGTSEEAKAAAAARSDVLTKGFKLFEEASAAYPEAADEIASLVTRMHTFADMTAQATDLALRDQDDAARKLLVDADKIAEAFGLDYAKLRDRMLATTATEAEVLTANTWSTIMTMLAGSLAGMGIGIGGALAIAAKGITGPIRRLDMAMGHLASGDSGAVVEGQDRRDEVGSMARAVQVFKDAALAKERLEGEATAARAAAEVGRDRQAAVDRAKAEDLRVFVHLVEASFEQLAKGDLTVRMEGRVAGEFEPIRLRFNEAVGTLEDALGSVVGSIGSIRVGLGEITVAAGDLSRRTEQQAASLEETVAALGDVVRGVNETAAAASAAEATASDTQASAEKGGTIVSRAVAAMNEIERSSGEIGKIIGVIDEIAFQTNLLALNAGVEAARAGEAGRGFAVVAQEVRGLAQRSAEAAKEIKNLIATSSAQVNQGVDLVTASGRSLAEIVSGVGAMTGVVSGIARAAREQSASLREVSVAADQMDKVTQQNAAMVEETTAAAQSLAGETEELARLTERFRTKTPASAGWGKGAALAARAPAAGGAPAAPGAHRTPPGPRAGRAVHPTSGNAALQAAPAHDEWEEF